MKSKWHNISIPHDDFKALQGIQKALPIKASIPQVIEWLIGVGHKQIQGDLLKHHEDNSRIPK